MRHRTGLRNRYRSGKSSYAKGRKSRERDVYATFSNGVPGHPCSIAGHQIWSVRKDTPRITEPQRRTTEPNEDSDDRPSSPRRVGKGKRTHSRH